MKVPYAVTEIAKLPFLLVAVCVLVGFVFWAGYYVLMFILQVMGAIFGWQH